MIVLAGLLIASTASATPKPGEYSNLDRGELVAADDGVPTCLDVTHLGSDAAVKATKAQLQLLYLNLHARVTAKGVEVVRVDGVPGLPVTRVDKTATAVLGWMDTGVDIDAGHMWQVAGVDDPGEHPQETLEIGLVIKKGDAIVCGDSIIGAAMRTDLPKPKKH